MATALHFVERGFSIAGQNAAETDIEASEANDALDILNDMMAEWELAGANLGFAPVKDLADEVRIPRGAYKAVKYNFAVLLGAEFEIDVSPVVIAIANKSRSRMMSIYKRPLQVSYPGTLPQGSGNECGVLDNDIFYDKVEKENF